MRDPALPLPAPSLALAVPLGRTRLSRIGPLLLSLLILAAVAPAAAAAALDGATRARPLPAAAAPKVALIVGPAGEATAGYRALAEEAAVVADQYTPNVVRVYSPDATWPAVRAAIEGASIVVYLGHGNGWPSRYRSSLYPPTQNGFGLNPVAGVDDETYQYFGERFIGDVRLARNAVVLLHRLCYASGNTEPGLPEGSIDDAVQRADNYAAGFVAAGAGAVIAEAHLGPAYYVRALLAGDDGVTRLWRASPNRQGHEQSYASSRSNGFEVRLDPDEPGSGFHRSIVLRGDPGAAAVREGASGDVRVSARAPSLASLGLSLAAPRLASAPIANSATDLLVPIAGDGITRLPRDVQVSVSWTALDRPRGAISDPAQDALSGEPPAPPAIAAVIPERPSDVVEPMVARRGKGRLVVATQIPSEAGRYRVSAILHDPSGVAYDAATQALLTPLLVDVAAPLSAQYGVQPLLVAEPGSSADLVVRVRNSGSTDWPARLEPRHSPSAPDPELVIPRTLPAKLLAVWVSVDGAAVPDAVEAILPIGGSLAGGEALVTLRLVTPQSAGSYLLLLDVVSPEHGALTAAGGNPAIVRVSVQE